MDSEVHVPAGHAATAAAGRSLLRLVSNDNLGGQEQCGDRRCVLQCGTRHLGGLDDAGREHVDVLARGCVEAPTRGKRVDLLRHDAALETGVLGDLLQRRGERNLDDVRASRLVTGQLELLEAPVAGLRWPAPRRHRGAGPLRRPPSRCERRPRCGACAP